MSVDMLEMPDTVNTKLLRTAILEKETDRGLWSMSRDFII